MKKRYYVYAYKVGLEPRNSCVIDIIFDYTGDGQFKEEKNNISIECFQLKNRMYSTYPPISKKEFETLYGKIDYP